MATKPVFRVVDIPLDMAAEQMEGILNGLTDEGYSLQSISYSWQNVGARAIFKLPARLEKGKWIRD